MAPALADELMAAASASRPALADQEGCQGWLRRCVEATLKGFVIGSGLKGGLALLSVVVRLRRLLTGRSKSFSHKPALLRCLFNLQFWCATCREPATATTNAEVVLRAAKDTMRHGIFLGAFAGTYVSADEFISAVWGRNRTARWRSFLAGLIAGPTMLLTGLETRHTSLATYILVRASVLAARCGIKSRRFGKLCKPLTWSQGDIFLMCLSSAQIASAYILNKDSFPSSYKAFLSKQIGKDPVVLQGLKELVNNNDLSSLRRIEKYYETVGVKLKLDPKMKVPCSILHGNQSCTGHFFSFLLQAYGRALPVYVPVYLIPALAIHRTNLVRRPYSAVGKNLLGIVRSSLFLSVYCASEWGWTCLLFRTFKQCNIPLLVLGTFPTGLALLIEKKSRRIEISLYCVARAIESLFTCIVDAGLCPVMLQIKRPDIVVFSIATSIIMHCYDQERDAFRSKYLNVLDWVCGDPGTIHR